MWWHALIGLGVALVIAAVWAIGVNWTWHHLELPMSYRWESDRMEREWKLELGHEGDPESRECWRWSLPEDVYERWCWRCYRWIPAHLFDVSVCRYGRTL